LGGSRKAARTKIRVGGRPPQGMEGSTKNQPTAKASRGKNFIKAFLRSGKYEKCWEKKKGLGKGIPRRSAALPRDKDKANRETKRREKASSQDFLLGKQDQKKDPIRKEKERKLNGRRGRFLSLLISSWGGKNGNLSLEKVRKY